MADELTVSAGFTFEKAFLSVAKELGQQQIDVAGTRTSGNVQDIGTATHELLVTGADFGTAGWAFFRNLDTTNYVELGLDVSGTFAPFAKLLAGEFFVVPLATKNIYAKASTASVKVDPLLVER